MADLALGRRGVQLLDLVHAVEQRGGLLERAVLRLDDEEVEEDGLEREPHAVDDLLMRMCRISKP